MNKLKDIFKKNKIYFETILLVFIILNIIFIVKNIYPYGNYTLIKNDLYAQYLPMLNELSFRIKNGNNLIYSFNEGLGMPIYRNFFNYLSSAFNIIFLLSNNLIFNTHLLIVLKIITISLTTLYYLTKKFETNNRLLIIPAILFSMCGWVSSYYFNIMWLDALIMLPLVTLGIEKLVINNKCKLYIFSLALTIIFNYYMAYMICAYSLIYFLFFNLYKAKKGSLSHIINELSKNFLLFLGSSLLAALLCSFMLAPLIYASSTLTSKLDMFTGEFYYNFNIIDFIASHLALSNNTVLVNLGNNLTSPNIYTGLISILLFIPFILDKKIDKKTKIFYLGLLGFICSFFFIPFLDYLINMLHIPADLPYRYSFMYSFILINILSYELLNLKDIKIKNLLVSFLFISIIIVLVLIFKTNKIDNSNVNYNIIFLVLLLISILIYCKINNGKYLLFLVILIELTLSFCQNKDFLKVSKINDLLYNFNIKNTDLFYRTEVRSEYRNLALFNNYYGLSSSSSMNYSKLYDLLYNLGNQTDFSAFNNYREYNPIINMLFNIKYLYDESLLENNSVLPLMFGIKNKPIVNLSLENNSFINQNEIIKSLTDIDNIYTKIKYLRKKKKYEDDYFIIYEYVYPDDTYLLFDASKIMFIINNNDYYGIYDIKINYDINYDLKFTYFNPFVIKIKNNNLIVCYLKDNLDEELLKTYKLDVIKLNKAYEILNIDTIKLTNFKENTIEGVISIKNSNTIFTSIPYDKGWKVYIDNKEILTYANYESLLGFDISSGNHSIRLEYNLPYFKVGSIISLISLVLFLYSYKIKRMFYKFKKIIAKIYIML